MTAPNARNVAASAAYLRTAYFRWAYFRWAIGGTG